MDKQTIEFTKFKVCIPTGIDDHIDNRTIRLWSDGTWGGAFLKTLDKDGNVSDNVDWSKGRWVINEKIY